MTRTSAFVSSLWIACAVWLSVCTSSTHALSFEHSQKNAVIGSSPPRVVSVPSPINWANLTAVTLHALNDSAFLNITSASLSLIPPSACTGFRSSQLAVLNQTANQCDGFTSMCFTNISSAAMPGLTSQCFSLLNPSVVGAVSPLQWSNTSAPIWGSISFDQLAAISNCSGFSQDIVESLGNGVWSDVACQGLTFACMQTLSPQAVSGLYPPCLTQVPDGVFYAMSADQISNMYPYPLGQLSVSQMGSFQPASCSGFTPYQLTSNNLFNLAGLTGHCLAYFTMAAFQSFTADVVLQLGPYAFSYLNSTQFGAIPADAISYLQASTLEYINPQACAGMTYQQMFQMTYYEEPCAQLQPGCAQLLSTGAMAGINPTCVQQMPPKSFASWNKSHIAALSNFGMAGITAQEFAVMSSDACSGFHGDQFEDIHGDACVGFTTTCVAALNLTVFEFLPSLCLGSMPVPAVSAFTWQQVAAIPSYTFDALTSAQFASLHSQCQGIAADQMAAIGLETSGNACAGIQPDCAQALPLTTIPGISASCLSFIPNATVAHMMLAQLQLLTPNAMLGLTWPQLSQLWSQDNVNVINQWSATQANAVSSGVIANFTAAFDNGDFTASLTWNLQFNLTQQSALSLSSCTPGCMLVLFANQNAPMQLPLTSWRGLRAAHVTALPTYGLSVSSITSPSVWQMWSSSSLFALSADLTAEIPVDCINAFNLSSLSPAGITGLTALQLMQLPQSSVGNLTCAQFLAITPQQQTVLQPLFPTTYEAQVKRCGAPPPAPPSGGNGPLSSTDYVLIGVGAGIVLIIFVACLWKKCCLKMQNDQSLDRALLQSD